MPAAERLIAGNWKMNGLAADLAEARALAEALAAEPAPGRSVALCPPATLLSRMAETLAGGPVRVGGQDCRPEVSGAYTGDLSAAMLVDAGASLVIVGHSERRQGYGETDRQVAAKAAAAVAAGLTPIICVGETLEERKAGEALRIVAHQVANSCPDGIAASPFAVAYEPVWAIGTGLTPSEAEIGEVHAAIRATLLENLGPATKSAPILYGGSVKPDNASAILAIDEVGGALVGGASLKAADFLRIIRA